MERGDQDTAALEVAEDGEIPVAILQVGVETAEEFRIGVDGHHVVLVDGTDGLAILVLTVILDLDVARRGARLEDGHQGFLALLPQAVILVVVEAVDRHADEPAVAAVLGLAGCQGDEFVAVCVDVDASIPLPVTGVDDRTVEGELDTAVLRAADVGGVAAHAGGVRKLEVEQDVVRALAVVFDRTGQSLVEETEVDTEVPGVGVFPAEVGVRKRGHVVAGRIGIAEVVRAGAEGTEGLVGVDGLVGGLAVAGAELQLVKPAAGARHEGLVVDVPTCGNGRIGVPLMALGQTRGSVGTDGGGNHVAVGVGIHHTTHVGDQAGLPVVGGVRADGDVLGVGLTDVVVQELLVGDVAGGHAVLRVGRLLGGVHGDHVEVVLLREGAVIGQQALEGPVDGLVVADAGAVGVGDIEAVDAHAREVAALVGAEVGAGGLLEGEAFDPGGAELDVAGVVGTEAEVLVDPAVGVLLDVLAGRDPDVVERHAGTDQVGAVSGLRVEDRGQLQDAVEAELVAVGTAVVGVGGEADLEPVGDVLVQAAAQGDAVEILRRDDGFVLIISGAEAVAALHRAADDAEFVVADDAGAVEEVLPVGIDGRVLVTDLVGILAGELTQRDELGSVHHRILDGVLEADVVVEAHLRGLSGDALVGGDQDDTVGAAGTVDGRGGGVLQDVHALDVARGDVGEGTHERHTVQDDERVVGGGEGTVAADADLEAGARTGVGLGHLHAGHTAVEGAGEVAGGHFTQVVTTHRGDGTGHVRLAGGTVTDDHEGVQGLGIVGEDDVDLRAPLHGHALGRITHARDLERCRGADLERISSAGVGYRAN